MLLFCGASLAFITVLTVTNATSSEVRKEVIEAHQVLMSMNTKNMEAFSKLVSALQKESEKSSQ